MILLQDDKKKHKAFNDGISSIGTKSIVCIPKVLFKLFYGLINNLFILRIVISQNKKKKYEILIFNLNSI